MSGPDLDRHLEDRHLEGGHPEGRWPDGDPRPVYSRGRVGRLWGGLVDYARTAWWGLVAPRVIERVPLVITQAVILREGAQGVEVLLTMRADLFGWELPGGTPEDGESFEETLAREVLEETGLEVEIECHVGNWVRTGFRPHTARIYRCRVAGGSPRASHETPRVGWFPVDAMPSGFFPWYRGPLEAGLAATSAESTALHIVERQGLTEIVAAMRIDLATRWKGLP